MNKNQPDLRWLLMPGRYEFNMSEAIVSPGLLNLKNACCIEFDGTLSIPRVSDSQKSEVSLPYYQEVCSSLYPAYDWDGFETLRLGRVPASNPGFWLIFSLDPDECFEGSSLSLQLEQTEGTVYAFFDETMIGFSQNSPNDLNFPVPSSLNTKGTAHKISLLLIKYSASSWISLFNQVPKIGLGSCTLIENTPAALEGFELEYDADPLLKTARVYVHVSRKPDIVCHCLLKDPDGYTVLEFDSFSNELALDLCDVQFWDDENPNLYELTITSFGTDPAPLDYSALQKLETDKTENNEKLLSKDVENDLDVTDHPNAAKGGDLQNNAAEMENISKEPESVGIVKKAHSEESDAFSLTIRFGISLAEIQDDQLKINGRRAVFRGIQIQERYFDGMGPSAVKKEMQRLKQFGINTLYKQSPFTKEQYFAADEAGLYLIEDLWIHPAGLDITDSGYEIPWRSMISSWTRRRERNLRAHPSAAARILSSPYFANTSENLIKNEFLHFRHQLPLFSLSHQPSLLMADSLKEAQMILDSSWKASTLVQAGRDLSHFHQLKTDAAFAGLIAVNKGKPYNPQDSFAEIKKIYSPVSVQFERNGVRIENNRSFSSTDDLLFSYSQFSKGKEILSGTFQADIQAGNKKRIYIPWKKDQPDGLKRLVVCKPDLNKIQTESLLKDNLKENKNDSSVHPNRAKHSASSLTGYRFAKSSEVPNQSVYLVETDQEYQLLNMFYQDDLYFEEETSEQSNDCSFNLTEGMRYLRVKGINRGGEKQFEAVFDESGLCKYTYKNQVLFSGTVMPVFRQEIPGLDEPKKKAEQTFWLASSNMIQQPARSWKKHEHAFVIEYFYMIATIPASRFVLKYELDLNGAIKASLTFMQSESLPSVHGIGLQLSKIQFQNALCKTKKGELLIQPAAAFDNPIQSAAECSVLKIENERDAYGIRALQKPFAFEILIQKNQPSLLESQSFSVFESVSFCNKPDLNNWSINRKMDQSEFVFNSDNNPDNAAESAGENISQIVLQKSNAGFRPFETADLFLFEENGVYEQKQLENDAYRKRKFEVLLFVQNLPERFETGWIDEDANLINR